MTVEWGTIVLSAIVSLLSAGGLGWIVTVKEDKRAKSLDNESKKNAIEEKKRDDVIDEWKDIATEERRRVAELRKSLDEKDKQVTEKDNIISDLRTKLDEKNTYCAVAELLKCEDLQCPSRHPPFGMKETKITDKFE